MRIPKETAKELAFISVGEEEAGFKKIQENLTDHSRWSVHYEMILEKDGNFYKVTYSQGATECQDESPFQYHEDEVELTEVKRVEKLVVFYE